MSDYEVSVTVGTYRPQWEKLRATLNSILLQQGVRFQIVVSDDGSEQNYFPKIKAYFEAHGFHDYKLVAGETNQGTVAQSLRGLDAADSAYVKGISPGDLLYDAFVLRDWLRFIKEQDADITFCDAVFYNRTEEKLNVIRHPHYPSDVSIYMEAAPLEQRIYNYLVLKQWISGAALLAKRDVFLRYIRPLLHRVTYCEDFFLRMAVLDDQKIRYFPSKGVWYEYADGGISTSGDAVWGERIKKDDAAMWAICKESYQGGNEKIKDWIDYCVRYNELYAHGAAWPRRRMRILQYLKNPVWFLWNRRAKKHFSYTPTDVDAAFFDKCFH